MAANSQSVEAHRDSGVSSAKHSRNGSHSNAARREREAKLEGYLRGIVDKGYASGLTVEMARGVWNELDAATGRRVDIPNAGPGPNGEMIFTWDRDEHHFELEVSSDEPPYLFYRNRDSEQSWGSDFELGQQIPAEAIRHLLSFAS